MGNETNNSHGWNRPSSAASTKSRDAHKAKSTLVKLIFSGIAFIAVGIGILCLLQQDKSTGCAGLEDSHKQITEVTPVSQRRVLPPETPAVDPDARPTKRGQQLNGYVMTPAGMICKIPTNKYVRAKPSYAIFDHMNENFIASILTMRPGDTVVGNMHFNGRFTKDFLDSLKEPIIVTKDDSPENAELKRAVNQAKIELKAAYDRGEDIEELVIKERERFQQLSIYKKELRNEVLAYAKREAASEQDLDDYLAAANKMLEAKGVAPIKDTPFVRIKLKMKEKWEDQK